MNFLRAIPRCFLIISLVSSLLLILHAPASVLAASGAATAVGYSLPVVSSFAGDNDLNAGAARPDVNIAASPQIVMEMTNFNFEIFPKQNGAPPQGPYPIQTTVFGEPNLASHHTTDPILIFDSLSGKWFAALDVCIDDSSGHCATWQLDLAVQNQGSETAQWWSPHFPAYNGFDRPFMAVTGDKVIVVGSVDLDASSPYCNGLACSQYEYWVIDKGQVLNHQSSVSYVTSILTCGNSNICIVPSKGDCVSGDIVNLAPVQALSSSNTGYLVGLIPGSSAATVELISVSGTPSIGVGLQSHFLTVSTIPSVCPGHAKQPSNVDIRTSTGFIYTGAWYQGKLWLGAETICTPLGDSTTRTCVRLIQIDTIQNVKTKDFDLNQTGTYLFRPALSVDGFGDMIITYGYSSSTKYPGVAAAALPATSQNSVSLLQNLKIGTAVAPPDGGNNPQRYGDYFGAAVDPADSSLIWVAGEYSDASLGTCTYADDLGTGSCWATWVASLRVVGLSVSISPSSLTVSPGSSGVTQLTLKSLGAFSGWVNLSSSVIPDYGYIARSFSPSSVQLALGGTGYSSLTISTASSMTSGIYTVYVTAVIYSPGSSSAMLAIVLPVPVTVPYFSLSASPKFLSFTAGSPGSSTASIIVKSTLDFYDATVSLAVNSPLAASLSSTSIFLPRGGSVSVTLTVSTDSSTSEGNYIVTVTATTGPYSASDTVTVIVAPPPCPPRGCPQSPTP